MHRWLVFALLSFMVGALPASESLPGGPKAALIEIDGPIGPATSLYFDHAMRTASDKGARLIILRLDTPGGLDGAMREIIKKILASDIPVAAYVAPAGARAASAGTYILYASHFAAMAPATNLGAATPIPVFGSAGPNETPSRPERDRSQLPTPPSMPVNTGERKAVNDAVAYIRSLAEQRGRNADWAESAVRQAVSLSAEEAQHKGVVDLISKDIPELLKQLDGRQVSVASGKVTLQTKNMLVEKIEPDWRMKLLSVIANPTVAYILMLIGIYGLLLEGYHPGAVLPGVVGAISLLIALYAFQILPINYAGLALIVLGIVMIVAETMVPSGALGIGGVISFVAGSILLFDTHVPGYQVPLGIIAAIATAASAGMLIILLVVMRSRQRTVTTGQEAILNQPAEALEDFDGDGWVRLHGERWGAYCDTPVRRGQRLRVVQVNGLQLKVIAENRNSGDLP